MKEWIRKVVIYLAIGLVFTGLIVYIYDGNFNEWEIIIQGALLFIGIAVVLEKILMLMYVKYDVHPIIRIQISVILSLGMFTLGVWLTRPWLLVEMFNIPIFMVTMFPMFVAFAVLFEWYFSQSRKQYNEKLNALKKKRLMDKKKA